MNDRQKILKLLFWETNHTIEQIENALNGDNDPYLKRQIYIKLLNFVNWYKLKEILSEEQMKEALQDDVLKGVFPKSWRETYKYVAGNLYK